MTLNRQNILAIILVISLIAGGYVWYSYFSAGSVDTSGDVLAPLIPDGTVSPEFLARAALLEGIVIDTEFFKSETFVGLEEGSKLPPLPEVRGRSNPFRSF